MLPFSPRWSVQSQTARPAAADELVVEADLVLKTYEWGSNTPHPHGVVLVTILPTEYRLIDTGKAIERWRRKAKGSNAETMAMTASCRTEWYESRSPQAA